MAALRPAIEPRDPKSYQKIKDIRSPAQAALLRRQRMMSIAASKEGIKSCKTFRT
jgi:hypothetical protein